MRISNTSALLATALIGLFAVTGCGGPNLPDTSPVTGTVLYQDKPVEGATVLFSRGARNMAEGEVALAKTDAEGKYVLTTHVGGQADVAGAVPEQYKVTVSKHVPPPGMSESQYQAMVDVVDKIAATGGMATPEQQPPPLVEMFPAKYSSAAQTELSADVAADSPNEFKFDLK